VRSLLLAAGLGTRLRPITETIPKCLVDIDGRPLLDYWIDLLGRAGVTEILVNLHHLPEQVEAYLSRLEGPAHVTAVREEKLLLTGGTVLANRRFFGREPFMVVHADNLSFFDVRAFIRRFETRDAGIEITMMTFHTDTPSACGIVELDERGTVRALHEKVASPPGNLANAAVYIFSPSVLEFIANLGKDVIDISTEVLPAFVGRISTFLNDIYHRDIGTPESLASARSEYRAALERHIAPEERPS